MWKSLGILNIFNTLTLKQVFLTIKTFLKKLEYRFLVQSTTNESSTFLYKTALLKANVKRQIEWGVKNEPITDNALLPLITSFFLKFNLSITTSYK